MSAAPLRIIPIALGFAVALTGCAAPTTTPATAPTPRPARAVADEAIRWSVGPCFGFCPVYSVTVSRGTGVTFEGERHTATLGRQVRNDRGAAFGLVSAQLAAFKPAAVATSEIHCERQTSDQAVTQITWTAPDGKTATRTYDRGCHSDENDALGAVLQSLPAQIGIGSWTRQVTRPGVSRG